MHEWMIFLDKKDRNLQFPLQGANISLRYIWADNNMVSNVFLIPPVAKKEGLDVFVYQTFPSPIAGTKTISFIHDVLFKDYPQFFTWKEHLYFVPLPWLTRKANRLIATTEYVAGKLVEHQYTPDRKHIDIVPLAVANDFKPRSEHNSQYLENIKEKFHLPDRYLLFVGRLNVRKNIENLLKAILIAEKNPLPLIIVGKEDWKTPNLEALLNHPNLNNRISIHRNMSNQELAATYALSTIFCFPSFAEGFGLPPLEAMASGIPVIVSKTSALSNVCGPAGTYIDPAEPRSIADALDRLLTDTAYYEEKKSAGLKQAASYTWTLSAHAFMKSIINASNSSRS